MLKIILLRSSTVVEQANGMCTCVCVCARWNHKPTYLCLKPLDIFHFEYFSFCHFHCHTISFSAPSLHPIQCAVFLFKKFLCLLAAFLCISSFIFASFLNNVRIYLAVHPAESNGSGVFEVIRRLDNGAKMWRREMKISFVSNAFLWSLVQHSKHELRQRHNFTWISLSFVGILHWKWGKNENTEKITKQTKKRKPLNQISWEKWRWNIWCNEIFDVIYRNNKMICAPLLKIICVLLGINAWNGLMTRIKSQLNVAMKKQKKSC